MTLQHLSIHSLSPPSDLEQHAFSQGLLFQKQGYYQAAMEHYQQVLAINPYHTGALNNLGVTLREQGQTSKAAETFRQLVSLTPSSGIAYFNLVQLQPSLTSTEIDNIRWFLQHPDLPETDRQFLHLTLAIVYNHLNLYSDAFFHNAEGNSLQRSRINYSSKKESAMFDSIIEIFNQHYFDEQKECEALSAETPIFIIGLPRSGSTLIEQIIASHPLAHGGGETPLLDTLLSGIVQKDAVFESLAALDEAAIRLLGSQYLEQLQSIAPDKTNITNKKLDNYLFLGLIATLFPRAKIIHCRRNPMDIGLSCFQTWFHTGQYFSYDLQEIGEYYKAYERLMNHWRRVLPVSMLEIQYEALVANPEKISRQIIDYCNLEWDEQCLLFHKNPRPVSTASDLQVRRPLYHSSIGRWEHYAEHLSPLAEALALTG
ncbi:sulfotransferase [Salinisphaera sp. G21_0]|uniref:sulfotransferase family protein n=1 Tax=Salinisphaera sp. G21_0 TaxID=2821094 RepID=UPI001ADA17D4|nr:sulfotransferase [Salinisphaera sp. G21_0]MBO9479971.1 sulfotransferase [Salinisphaera sp. G21_0]